MKLGLTLILSFFCLHLNAQTTDLEIEDKFVNDLQQESEPAPTVEPEINDDFEDDEESLEFTEADIDEPDQEESDEEFSKAEAEKESYATSTADPSVRPYSVDNLKNTTGKEIKVEHPYTQKGLTRITRDQTYLYDVKKSPQSKASTVLFSTFDPTNFIGSGTDDLNNTYTFQDFYTPQMMITADYEWQKFKTGFGKFGYKLGSGLMIANGNGYFKDGTQSFDKLTMFMLPNFASVIWRMKVWDKQPIIPYLEAGVGYYVLIEYKPDDNKSSFGAAPVVLGKGGLAFDISSISRDTGLILDRDYGINSVSFNVEYKIAASAGGDLDLSYDTISFGFGFEY